MTLHINDVPVIHEDATFIVVNKPSGMLSQPGKHIQDSVETRVRHALSLPSEPILVHRLDMDTSGLMLLARNRASHRILQQQFEKRQVGKRYRAVLEQKPEGLGGRINLPIRLDVDNRPTQIVCYKHGKSAITAWHQDADVVNGVVLYPLTGRSHQLRVHLADPAGLGIPIRGDRLYGTSGSLDADERLMLHADYLAFYHPKDGSRVKYSCPSPF